MFVAELAASGNGRLSCRSVRERRQECWRSRQGSVSAGCERMDEASCQQRGNCSLSVRRNISGSEANRDKTNNALTAAAPIDLLSLGLSGDFSP